VPRHKSAACAGATIAASAAPKQSTQIETNLIIATIQSRRQERLCSNDSEIAPRWKF
jgi:hypothetical protein